MCKPCTGYGCMQGCMLHSKYIFWNFELSQNRIDLLHIKSNITQRQEQQQQQLLSLEWRQKRWWKNEMNERGKNVYITRIANQKITGIVCECLCFSLCFFAFFSLFCKCCLRNEDTSHAAFILFVLFAKIDDSTNFKCSNLIQFRLLFSSICRFFLARMLLL